MMKERSFPLLHSTPWLGSGSGQGKRSPESLTHILLGNQTIVILIQRINTGLGDRYRPLSVGVGLCRVSLSLRGGRLIRLGGS